MNDFERKLAETLIQTRKISPEEMERCLSSRQTGETLVDALVRQGTIQTGELERVLDVLPAFDEDADHTFARAIKKIGRYRVISELGRGGMGRVYLAYDPNLKRSVALKVMRIEELEDAARYRRETEIAAGLQHPNIAAIYDAQQEEETFILAMQYIDGDSLDKARLDPREALKAIAEAARAVHYAHEHGIIHRDIKPENMMRTREGRVFIMDFGVARRMERKASLTQTGTVIGTPMYMSPEQAAGRILDVRTDVYSLGATLYSLIAGRPPFVGASVLDIIQRIGKADPPKLHAFQPDLHRDVATIVQKTMRKERIRRYQTALSLAEDIERHLSGDPIEARPMPLLEKGVRHLRKRPWMVNALLFLALAIGVGSGLVWREQVREEALERKQQEQLKKQERRDLAAERLAQAKQNLEEWDRYLLFAPRDLTPKRQLLSQAVSLCIAAKTLAGGRLSEADFLRSRALALLGRYPEAELAATNAIETRPEGRFHLQRARIRLQWMMKPLVGLPVLHADLYANPELAGRAVKWFLQEIDREETRDYLEDLVQAENLGRSPEEPRDVPGVVLMSDYTRARELCEILLNRFPDPGQQAEIHQIMAWVGYRELVLGHSVPGTVLLDAEEQVTLALEGKRSDADLYRFQAELAAGWALRSMECRSAYEKEKALLKSERLRVVNQGREGLKTALVIQPGDVQARILSAQLLLENVSPEDWVSLRESADKGKRREVLRRILREFVLPAERILEGIVRDHSKEMRAWIQWIVLQWQQLLLENFIRNDEDPVPGALLERVSRLDATASRGLKFASEKADRGMLLFFRALASFMRSDLVKGPLEKKKALEAFNSDMEVLRTVAPRLWNEAKDLPSLRGGK